MLGVCVCVHVFAPLSLFLSFFRGCTLWFSLLLSCQISTNLQTIWLVETGNPTQLPAVGKQGSAFPPNFVHSLDSAHMMMTANACRRDGVTFASVHDSYWTHAAYVMAPVVVVFLLFLLSASPFSSLSFSSLSFSSSSFFLSCALSSCFLCGAQDCG